MRRSLIMSAMLMCAAIASSALAQEATPPPVALALTAEQQAEITAAEANTALIATRAEWASGPEAEYPDAERALGHNGRVEVRGLLGVDGRVRYASVSQSSRAPALDAIALASVEASVYQPAKDASGNPIPTMLTTNRFFENYTSSEGVSAAIYTCPQFVLDMDWYKQTWGEDQLHEHRFYLMIRGLGTIARMNSGAGIGSIESNESYLGRWNRAIETCRAHPNWRFAQALRPEGEYIDNMARNAARRRN